MCGSLFPNFLEKNRHASGVCLLRFCTLSFSYGDPMYDTAPLQSHYQSKKVRETEIAHAAQQMKLLGERVLAASNPKRELPKTVSVDDDSDGVRSAREHVKSFKRILREHTERDIVYRTDEDGDPDFPVPAAPTRMFPREDGVIDEIESVELDDQSIPSSEEMVDTDDATLWSASVEHTPSPPPPGTPEPQLDHSPQESSSVLEGSFSPTLNPTTPVKEVESEPIEAPIVPPVIEPASNVWKSTKAPLSVRLPLSSTRADSVSVPDVAVGSKAPSLRQESPPLRPERSARLCVECNRKECLLDSYTCSLRCERKAQAVLYLLSSRGKTRRRHARTRQKTGRKRRKKRKTR